MTHRLGIGAVGCLTLTLLVFPSFSFAGTFPWQAEGNTAIDDASQAIPRASDGRPDLSGIW